MRLQTRLERIKEALDRRGARQSQYDDWYTEEQWLLIWEMWGHQGLFADQQLFRSALAEYRQALEAAQAQSDPPFDPPDSFMPSLADLPHLRLLNWRTSFRFPAVERGWERLAALAMKEEAAA